MKMFGLSILSGSLIAGLFSFEAEAHHRIREQWIRSAYFTMISCPTPSWAEEGETQREHHRTINWAEDSDSYGYLWYRPTGALTSEGDTERTQVDVVTCYEILDRFAISELRYSANEGDGLRGHKYELKLEETYDPETGDHDWKLVEYRPVGLSNEGRWSPENDIQDLMR